jgi:hypothetical protein
MLLDKQRIDVHDTAGDWIDKPLLHRPRCLRDDSVLYGDAWLCGELQTAAEQTDLRHSAARRRDAVRQIGRRHAATQSARDPEMRWDAYCYTPDPNALDAELAGRGASPSNPLKDTTDGLRGFEITDPDGYVLFFGRPR